MVSSLVMGVLAVFVAAAPAYKAAREKIPKGFDNKYGYYYDDEYTDDSYYYDSYDYEDRKESEPINTVRRR